MSDYINPKRLVRLAILIKPGTLIKFHKFLIAKKCELPSRLKAVASVNACKAELSLKAISAQKSQNYLGDDAIPDSRYILEPAADSNFLLSLQNSLLPTYADPNNASVT